MASDIGDIKLYGYDPKIVETIGLFTHALTLVGITDKDTVESIILPFDADINTLAGVVSATTVQEYENEVIGTFTHAKTDQHGAVTHGPPGLQMKAKVRMARELCISAMRLRDLPAQISRGGAAAASTGLGQTMQQPSAVASRKLKLKDLVDQVTEDECDVMTEKNVAECYARYETLMGEDEKPAYDEDPTLEQLSAVGYLLRAGINPYVDFGVFGPHGHRILKKIKLSGSKFNNNGELMRIEINGPATYPMWCASWQVYANCLLMHDAVDLGKLVAYKRKMDTYYQKFGDQAWALQYQTDVRTRHEHFGRLKREGFVSYNHAWDEHVKSGRFPSEEAAIATFKHAFHPDRPWDYVFAAALKDTQWWLDELELPLIHHSKKSIAEEVDGDAPINGRQSGKGGGLKRNLTSAAPPPDPNGYSAGTRVKKPREPVQKQHNVKDGQYTTSRNGTKLCWGFNAGTCLQADGQHRCAKNPQFLHICSKCLQPKHTALQCYAQIQTPNWFLNRGKGKGDKGGDKGTGKKGYKGQG